MSDIVGKLSEICQRWWRTPEDAAVVKEAAAEIVRLRAEVERKDAAIALVRRETLGEAARVADDLGYECEGCGHLCGNPETDIAIIEKAGGLSCCPERKIRPLGAAIRALGEK